MVLAVPCTRLTRCIVAHEFGTDPIPLTRSHPLWVFLRPHAEGDHVRRGHMHSAQSSQFLVKVNKKKSQLLRERHNDAAEALHRHHLDMMMRFTWAATISGQPSRAALRAFMNLYNIDDEDYDLDSAYRSWQRFKTSFPENIPTKHCEKKRLDVAISRKPSDAIAPTEPEVEALARFITGRLHFRLPKTPCYVLKQVSIWLHVRHARFKKEYVAQKFNCAVRTVEHSVQRINGYVKVDQELADLILPERLFQ